jgi:hypothetical protein
MDGINWIKIMEGQDKMLGLSSKKHTGEVGRVLFCLRVSWLYIK